MSRPELLETAASTFCDECTRKFVRWWGEKIARSFPTSAMKKLQRKNE